MRYRPSAGRLILELFYGEDDCIERSEGVITVHISKLARKLHVRPVRLCETLDWLSAYGIVANLKYDRKTATLGLKAPEWAAPKRKVWNG